MTSLARNTPLPVGGDDFELSPALIDTAQFSNLRHPELGASEVSTLLTNVSGLVSNYLSGQAAASSELADMLAAIGSITDETLKQECYAAYDQACLAIAAGKPATAALSNVRDIVTRVAGQSVEKVLREMSVAEREQHLMAERDRLIVRLTQEGDRLRGELTQYIDPATNDRIAELREAANRETDPIRKQQAELAVLAAEREAGSQAVQGTNAAVESARASGDADALARAEAARARAAEYQATIRAREELVREQLRARYVQAGMSPERAEQQVNQDAARILSDTNVQAAVADTSIDLTNSTVIARAVDRATEVYGVSSDVETVPATLEDTGRLTPQPKPVVVAPNVTLETSSIAAI